MTDNIHVGHVIKVGVVNGTVNIGGNNSFTQLDRNTVPVQMTESVKQEVEESWWNKYIGNSLAQTFIGSTYNTYFGSNRTHIVNYSGVTIVVILACCKFFISELELSSEEFSMKLEAMKHLVLQRVELVPGKMVRFERNNRIDSLTILLKLPNGNYRITAAMHIYANMSYRIYKDGIPFRTPYDAL